jgi:hypothetical protein
LSECQTIEITAVAYLSTFNNTSNLTGTKNAPNTQNFYTAIRDFDIALRASLAASPRQILAQAKDVMRKFNTIIEACAAVEDDKADYFRRLKIHAQNAKTNAIGTMLRAVENASQYGDGARPRLMSVLGSFDWHAIDHQPEGDVHWIWPADANRLVAAYRIDQLLNANLVGRTLFLVSPSPENDGMAGIAQRWASSTNDLFDALMAEDNSQLRQTARQLRRENQWQLLQTLLMPTDAIRELPAYADGAFSFKLLALDGELLTLAMDDLLDSKALGVLSQQLIEIHAYLLQLELNGNLFNPSQWNGAAQMMF